MEAAHLSACAIQSKIALYPPDGPEPPRDGERPPHDVLGRDVGVVPRHEDLHEFCTSWDVKRPLVAKRIYTDEEF
jgi:hypothetical protein